jgi:hypothetical protein
VIQVDISKGDMCLIISLLNVCGDMSGQGNDFRRINQKLNESIGIKE